MGNGVRLAGWALDWDTNGPLTVRVTVDGQVVATPLANLARSDIANAYPGMGPNHGFDVTVPLSGGTHTVCAAMVNAGPGTDSLLGCRTVTSQSPFGSLDALTVGNGSITVGGWALDPDTTSPIQVHVYVGSQGTAIVADQSRPDVDAAYGKGPNHGFNATLPAAPGVQQILVYAINTGVGSNVLIAQRTVEIGAPVRCPRAGRCGGTGTPVACRSGAGPSTPTSSGPIPVHVYVGGVGTAIIADKVRNDLVPGPLAPYGATHGFEAIVPGPTGRQTVDVYAINDNGPNKLIASRSVDVISGSPFGSRRPRPGRARHRPGRRLGPRPRQLRPDRRARLRRRDRHAVTRRPVPQRHRRDLPGLRRGARLRRRAPGAAGLAQRLHLRHRRRPRRQPPARLPQRARRWRPLRRGRLRPGRRAVRSRVGGWAIDPDTADPIDVHVYVDSSGRAITADGSRPDVAAAFPGYGANHGFAATFPIAPGTHQVCIYAIDQGLGEQPAPRPAGR